MAPYRPRCKRDAAGPHGRAGVDESEGTARLLPYHLDPRGPRMGGHVMDPVILIIVPGFLGGLVIALLFIRLHGRPADAASVTVASEPLSTDVINMARIRVAGVGGLGLVAMALTVAWAVPRIRQTLAAGLLLGAIGGVVLILRRRRNGPMPSSGRRPRANTTLSIDDPLDSRDEQTGDSPMRRTGVPAVPASSSSPA